MRAQGVARAAKAKTEVTEIGAKDTKGDSIFWLGFLHWSSSILCCEFDCTKESFDQFLDERTCFYQHQGGSRFAPVQIKRVSFRWLYLYMILMYTHSNFLWVHDWQLIQLTSYILELVAHKAGRVGNMLGTGNYATNLHCASQVGFEHDLIFSLFAMIMLVERGVYLVWAWQRDAPNMHTDVI